MKTIKKLIIIAISVMIMGLIILYYVKYKEEKDLNKLPVEADSEIINREKEIVANEYNSSSYKQVSEDKRAIYILENFKEKALYNVELAYNNLDDEYREKKFGSFSEFEKFIKNKINELKKSSLYKYDIMKYDDYTRYIVTDQYGNNYIFNETEVLEYKVYLDNYTVNFNEFIEKYNSSTNQVKVALNIDKFVKALNDKSYYYIYNSLLSQGFKNNYFSTLEDFENYANEKFFENNKIEYVEYKEDNGLLTYTINIVNADKEEEEITKKIIMKLNEETDFEMSFDI